MAAISQTTPVSTLSAIGHSREARSHRSNIHPGDLLYHFRARISTAQCSKRGDAPDSSRRR